MSNENRSLPGGLWVVWALALLLTTGIALNASPWLFGDADWRWRYVPLVVPMRLARVAALFALYLALAAGLWRWAGRGARRGGWVVAFAVLASLVIQFALQTLSNPDPLSALMLRTTSPFLSGYHDAALEVGDVGDFLRRFPEIAAGYLPHPQRHPPGLILYFVGVERLLEQFPALAAQIARRLHLYRCEFWPLLYAGDAPYAAAIGGLLAPLLNALALIPLYAAGRSLIGHSAALAAVLVSPLIPGYGLWAGLWDPALVLITALLLCLLDLALRKRCRWAWWAAGGLLSAASFFTHAALVLAGFVVLYVLVRYVRENGLRGPRTRQWPWDAFGFVAGLSSLWLIYWLAFGVTFFDVYRATTAPHFEMSTHYASRLWYNPYDFVLFLGFALGLLWLAALRQIGRARMADPGQPLADAHGLVLAFTLTLAALTLSGISRGEVGRVWVFLMPLAVLSAFAVEGGPAHSVGRWLVTAGLLGAQTLTMQSVLALDDAIMPSPAERYALHQYTLPPSAITVGARVGENIELAAYEVDRVQARPGDALHLTLYWRALQPLSQSYTVFVHVYENGLGLAAQRDSPPRDGQYPTTCWRPDEIVADPIPLEISPQAAPGVYELIAGMYDPAAGNQRLPTHGLNTRDLAVILTRIEVSTGEVSPP
jgi:hypothetical protein